MEPGVVIPESYYGAPDGAFVRADITYLRQDFSTMQPVENANPWPALQRYDFLVRTRPATPEEITRSTTQSASTTYPQREAILYALRQLSGQDLGAATEAWQKYVEEMRTRKVP
jgi:hypothetical protein